RSFGNAAVGDLLRRQLGEELGKVLFAVIDDHELSPGIGLPLEAEYRSPAEVAPVRRNHHAAHQRKPRLDHGRCAGRGASAFGSFGSMMAQPMSSGAKPAPVFQLSRMSG